MKAKRPVATMLEAESGMVILRKIVSGLAPSTFADSSISIGIFWKNSDRISTENGSVSRLCTAMIESLLSSSPAAWTMR